MLGIVSRLFGNLIIATCFFSLTFFFLSLAVLFRLLPRLLPVLRSLLRWFWILSFRLYAFILLPVSRFLNIDLFNGIPRVVASIFLSTTPYFLVCHFSDWPLNNLGIGVLVLHGLIVGLIWDGILDPGGFQLGANIQ